MVRRTALALSVFTLGTLGIGVAHTFAQTVDEIVAKNYATRGGPSKWKSIQTQKMTGTAMGQGVEVGMTIYAKRPNLGRQEVVVEIPGQGPIAVTSVFDGVKAWSSNPMTGSDAFSELGGPEADTIKDQSDFDGSLVEYRAKGHTVELVGTESVGAKKAHHLKVTRKDLPAQHFYLDTETGLELRVTTEAGSGPATDTELSDYRTVDGVQVAHMIRISQNGAVIGELRIATIEFNVPLADALFKVR
jgi:outer membrane lipoprotein-sorting protein